MKVKTTAHIYYCKWEWEEEGQFQLFSFKIDDDTHRTYVREQEIEIEVPDNYDPRAQKIAVLEKQKERISAEFHKAVTEINDRISKLQALEYSGGQS